MGRVAGKKLFSIMALCAMIGLLLLPIVVRFLHWLLAQMHLMR